MKIKFNTLYNMFSVDKRFSPFTQSMYIKCTSRFIFGEANMDSIAPKAKFRKLVSFQTDPQLLMSPNASSTNNAEKNLTSLNTPNIVIFQPICKNIKKLSAVAFS